MAIDFADADGHGVGFDQIKYALKNIKIVGEEYSLRIQAVTAARFFKFSKKPIRSIVWARRVLQGSMPTERELRLRGVQDQIYIHRIML